MIPVGVAGATVLIDVSGTPFGGTPTWTDVTDYVLTTGDDGQPMTGTWGRQDYLGDVTAATATIIFDNPDGRFTPGLATSPYFPYIRNGTRVRVQMEVASIVVYLFDGYADSWEHELENGIYGICTLNATDILGRFGNDNSLRGFLVEEMVLDAPMCIYALQEAEGSTSFGELIANMPAASIGNSKYGPGVVAAGQSPSSGLLNASMVAVTNAEYGTWTTGNAEGSWLSIPTPALGSAFTIEVWVQMPTALPPALATVLQVGTGTLEVLLQLTNIGMQVNMPGSTFLTTDGYCDGGVHHFVIVWDAGAGALYVDGELATSGSGFGTPGINPTTTLGLWLAGSTPQQPFTGAYAYFALYSTDLSLSRIQDHYNAGANAFQGERTDLRATRLLSYRPNVGSNLDVGLGFMGQQDIASESFGQALLDCGDVEAGIIYADGQGQINLRSRSNLFNPGVDLTLDCSLQQVDVPTTVRDDNGNYRNDITVTRVGGADSRYFNAASVAEFGTFEDSITLAIDTDANALNMAGWLVAVGSQEPIGSPTFSVDLLTEPSSAVVLQALLISLLNVVEAINLPASVASPFSSLVEGGTWTVGVEDFELAWYTTPLPPPVAVWDATNWDAAPVWAF